MASDGGKGDKDRTADRKAFGSNWDKIKWGDKLKDIQFPDDENYMPIQPSPTPPADIAKKSELEFSLKEFAEMARKVCFTDDDGEFSMTCQNCKHWGKGATSPLTNSCQNVTVNNMMDGDDCHDRRFFSTHADFGCNRFEAKS